MIMTYSIYHSVTTLVTYLGMMMSKQELDDISSLSVSLSVISWHRNILVNVIEAESVPDSGTPTCSTEQSTLCQRNTVSLRT